MSELVSFGQFLADDQILLVEGHAELEDVALFAMRGEVGEHLGGVFARVDLRAALPARTCFLPFFALTFFKDNLVQLLNDLNDTIISPPPASRN